MPLLVGTRKGLFLYGDDLAEPAVHFAGVPVTMVLADARDGTVYAAVGHGHFGVKLHRSDDGGASFTEVAAPSYPPKPDDVDDRCPMRGIPIPWNTELLWALEAGHPDRPGQLWAGTIPGGLFRSDDRGEYWELNRPLWDMPYRHQWVGGGYDYPGIHSICVHPEHPDTVLVAASCGGTWTTADGGATWEVGHGMEAAYVPPELVLDPYGQDPHRVVRCHAAPEVLWNQHHSYAYRSTDSGATWQRLKPAVSDFGFTVAVHPTDPDTAWFVPAVTDEMRIPVDGRLVVTRTRDGGQTWDVLTDGLPSGPAYDLIYRHGLDVDRTGTRLAMGSTTGSLWASADGGDHWRLLSGHLPPIACVRWS
jgi:hypothetical protein